MAKKRSKKFIQKAVKKMQDKGTVGSYGHHSVAEMKADKKKGGKVAKKANFALNMERIAKKHKKANKKS